MYTKQSSEPATMQARPLLAGKESGQNALRTGVLFEETWKDRLRRSRFSDAVKLSSLMVLSRHEMRISDEEMEGVRKK